MSPPEGQGYREPAMVDPLPTPKGASWGSVVLSCQIPAALLAVLAVAVLGFNSGGGLFFGFCAVLVSVVMLLSSTVGWLIDRWVRRRRPDRWPTVLGTWLRLQALAVILLAPVMLMVSAMMAHPFLEPQRGRPGDELRIFAFMVVAYGLLISLPLLIPARMMVRAAVPRSR